MTSSTNRLLTATRMSTLRACPRRHYLRYELGLARVRQDAPLRLGAAFHCGLESRNRGMDAPAAMAEARAGYDIVPDWADPTDWAVERETLAQLLAGHFWRYENDNLEILAAERTFELPLSNPDTGKSSRAFVLAGKIDAIVKLPDGRLAVLEYKTAGEDIGPDAEYWLRLRCDPQISLYLLAARAMGFDVAMVLYDVTRKPSIRLRQNETPEQFGQRLLDDIAQRPDFYFARREVPRLEDDLAEYQAEVWQQAQQLLEIRRRAGRLGDPSRAWFRNAGRFTCGYCDFAQLCLNSVRVQPGSPAPCGFQLLADPNPELDGASA
jgi:hypothetical protein